MGKELDPRQREFIKKFLVDKTKSETSKITAQYLDYDRRHKKVAADVATLEATHPQAASLKQQLVAAEKKAAKGEFKEAYADLAAVRKASKGFAKGYVTGLSTNDVLQEIARVDNELNTIMQMTANARQGMANLTATAQQHPKCSDQNDLEAASEYRRDFTQTEAIWRAQMQQHQTMVDNAATLLGNLDLKNTLTTLAHRATAMQQQGDSKQKKAAEALTTPLLALNKKAASGGNFLTGSDLKDAFKQQAFAFEDALKPITDMSSFQGNTDRAPALDSFKHLDKREAERLRVAQERYTTALRGDNMLQAGPGFGQSVRDRQPAPRQLATFQVDDVFPNGVDDLNDDDVTPAVIDQAKQAVRDNIAQWLTNAPPNGDEVFDLMCKCKAELMQDLAEQMGMSVRDTPWTKARHDLITGMADEVMRAVEANSPNKIADDGQSLTLNGVQYGQPEKIGKGGLGDIFRFVGPNGEKIIAKLLQDGNKQGGREEMANEMRMHRLIAGGENVQPHPNVLPMKGGAVGKNGQLIMLMEEAEGGDLNQMSNALNELSRAGIIPEGARTAMVQRTMQQAVRGLRAVHAQDAMHLDVKGQNFLLDGDGNVQIADFGSAALADDDGKVDTSKSITSAAFSPPQFGTRISKQEEVFWLGSMLESMSSGVQDSGTNKRSGGFQGDMTNMQGKESDGAGGQQIKRQTALDRLRNAMIDPDPQKRPSLEGVLLSSYLDDVERSYTDDDVTALSKATAAYNKAVGRRLAPMTNNINFVRAAIELEQKKVPPGSGAQALAGLKKQLVPLQQELAMWQQQIDALHNDPAIKPLLQAVEQAAAPFR